MSGNASHIANINPIRYRSYYYDRETGYYYLQSRYYDPEIGRFISADSQVTPGLIGTNLFAYCYNNPVNLIDPDGKNPLVIFAGLGTALQVAIVATLVVVAIAVTYIAARAVIDTVEDVASYVKAQRAIAKRKPINMPSGKKVTIAMEHTLSGHGPGGNRGNGKDKFPYWATPPMIEKMIREAYKTAEKLGPMVYSIGKDGVEYLMQFFQGYSEFLGQNVQFYYDHLSRTITTAWPK